MFNNYVVLDIERDGQAVPRVLWIEGIKVSNGIRVSDFYAFNFCDAEEESLPNLFFGQELMSFIKGLPIVCFESKIIKQLVEYELMFFQFDGFNEYFCVKDLAIKKLYRNLSINDLLVKFDLTIFDRKINLETNVEDIFNIYERLKML